MRLRPAIDLRGGRVVRLYQGDYAQETVYGQEPAATARQLARAGVDGLHIVDLDGAREGRPMHLETLAAIRRAVEVPLEFGGGLRTSEAVDAVLGAGVERVLIGTAALRDPSLVRRGLDRWGAERLAVSLDGRGDEVRVAGWREGGTTPLRSVAAGLKEMGVEVLVHTAVDRDGTLAGPDLEALAGLFPFGFQLWAAGGIGSVEDLEALAGLGGVTGAILGRSLYEGSIDLAAALSAMGGM